MENARRRSDDLPGVFHCRCRLSSFGPGSNPALAGRASQHVNTPPVANLASYTRSTNLSLKISVPDLLANFTTDADGDPRSLVSVGSGTNGATVSVADGWIFYLPSGSDANRNTTDHLDYIINDGVATASSQIRVEVVDPNPGGQSANLLGINDVAGGKQIRFAGIPGYTYHIQRTTLLNGVNTVWDNLGLAVTDGGGSGQFTDTNPPPGGAYYRTVWP